MLCCSILYFIFSTIQTCIISMQLYVCLMLVIGHTCLWISQVSWTMNQTVNKYRQKSSNCMSTKQTNKNDAHENDEIDSSLWTNSVCFFTYCSTALFKVAGNPELQEVQFSCTQEQLQVTHISVNSVYLEVFLLTFCGFHG